MKNVFNYFSSIATFIYLKMKNLFGFIFLYLIRLIYVKFFFIVFIRWFFFYFQRGVGTDHFLLFFLCLSNLPTSCCELKKFHLTRSKKKIRDFSQFSKIFQRLSRNVSFLLGFACYFCKWSPWFAMFSSLFFHSKFQQKKFQLFSKIHH
jgi:hypothetical protein